MDRELTAPVAVDVLVVDDDPDVRALLVRALRAEGHGVRQAATVAEALAALDAGAPDVALLDKNLPDGSGVDVLRALRARALETEAIVITGYASLESSMEAVRLGAFDYVEKPFDSLKAVANRVARAAERGRSRAALRARNEALAAALADLEAAQERLLAARRLATLSETAAGLAHAIKNPLHATLLGVSNARLLARAGDAPARLAATFDGIEANLRHLLGLVEGFLHAARAGAPAGGGTRAAPHAAAAAAVTRLAPQADAAGVTLALDGAADADPGAAVRLGPDTLVEAVQNLVRNALEATPRGGAVRVGVRHAGSAVHIAVEDTGPGFDAESAARAFELFYTTRQDGYGLGLCQVSVAAETAGGRCTIGRSAALGGAAVTLLLPLVPDEEG
jgi:signal transduction histidine kinase